MISVNELSCICSGKLLFQEANFILNPNKRYALVGANGCGKSTLLRILAGIEEANMGDINTPKNYRIGWLKQDFAAYDSYRVLDVVIQGNTRLFKAISEKEQILNKEDISEQDCIRLADLEEIINNEDGYAAEAFAHKLLTGLGLEQKYHYKPFNLLSGGYKLRVLMAQMFFDKPDVLLLDEPTNHLDIMTIGWLESYLKNEFSGVLLFISHDLAFLNNLAHYILDIDYGQIRQYTGTYNKFLETKTALEEQKLKEKENTEKEVARIQAFIDRFKAKASKAKQCNSRIKMLDKIEMPDIINSSRRYPKFMLSTKKPSGKYVLKVNKIDKAFGDKQVLSNINFTVNKNEKLCIIGHNGIGKSTLLKIVLDKLKADSGDYEWGHNTQVGYLNQDFYSELNQDITMFQWLRDKNPGTYEPEIRSALGLMLFSGDEPDKKLSVMSGGECCRLFFADLIIKKPNVLVLDEPTNHLDVEAKASLMQALKEYPGTLILVSHDRTFVKEIATSIIAITENGITYHNGNYTDYLKEYGEDYLSKIWLKTNKA